MNTEKNYLDLLLAITRNESFSKQLATELMESDTDPTDFFNKHKEEYFSNRGISAPGNPEQTLCYLLDKLDEKDFIYELDWKADSEEFNYALKLLSNQKIEEDLFSEEDEEDSDGMFEMIFDAEDRLEAYDFAIVQFPLESDSHPIALVPLERGEEIQTMIDELFGRESI